MTEAEQTQGRPTRKDFETLIYKQLHSGHDQIRNAFKETVALITDQYSAREALAALKDPIKKDSALIQLKSLSILGALVKNCGQEFHAELATKKWIDRLLKIVRTTRDDRVRDKILQLLVDWQERFQYHARLQEFNIAIHRLKAKNVELPQPSEKTTRRPNRKKPPTEGSAAGTKDKDGRRPRTADPQQNLTAMEVLISNMQADMSNLELGLQRPEMLQPGIADECRSHLQKIQAILSTELPDAATYQFLHMQDQFHELLGLYDALFTDGAPEEVKAEKEANEMKQIEREIEKENELKTKREEELRRLRDEVEVAKDELGKARADQARKLAVRPRTDKERQVHQTLTNAIGKAANVKAIAKTIRLMLREETDKTKVSNQEYVRKLPDALMDFREHVERSKLGETKAFQALKKLYAIEVATRKKLYNKLQELRGNIRVYCRVRPLNGFEGAEMCVQFPSEGELVVKEGSKQKLYEFDIVFDPSVDQETVFEDTKPLINCVVDGYKVCIFAYGQTGSGKTHTMQGPQNNPGINKRALLRLFELIDERREIESTTVNLSVIEIYNETIKDLLREKVAVEMKYEIKTHPTDGQYIAGMTSHEVKSLEDVEEWMKKAEKNRSVGRTNMNEHSSRSHMLLYIVVRTVNLQSSVTTVGKLSLVDLAGSERLDKSGAVGDRRKETNFINQSLTALGLVISSLSSNQGHIPYRNSKLTHLLQDSLGGNSKCLMFVNVSPASSNANESNNSLAFAARARGVVLGPAKRNIEK